MPATNFPISCRAAGRGSCSGAAAAELQTGAPFDTKEQTDNIIPMISDIRHHPSPLPQSDHGPAEEQCPTVETGAIFYF